MVRIPSTLKSTSGVDWLALVTGGTLRTCSTLQRGVLSPDGQFVVPGGSSLASHGRSQSSPPSRSSGLGFYGLGITFGFGTTFCSDAGLGFFVGFGDVGL
jgi:hypothetical protein